MRLETLLSVGWVTVAAISSWLLIDGFRSGQTIGFRRNQNRVSNPARFWSMQVLMALVLGAAVYGLFRALESMRG
ncbi:MAG TPA: hypothetical protein VG942_16820 [Hyphomonadaceae bacterium]|nr:hypothetical protein [Hyphomonadaceae bacterium]